ncbi:hypothetical protein DID96_36230 [Burkholderia sp. Bp8963]|nr:hypothetical protein DID96_36230 [Burkholderia sp. Bp8963]
MKRMTLNIILGLATLTAAEWVACGTLMLGLSLAGIVTPLLYQELHVQEDQLRAPERTSPRSVVKPISGARQVTQRLNHFYSVLAPEDQLEGSVGKLFELAGRSGVTLEKADYRIATEKAGQYKMYQIDLPMRSSYSTILGFCEQVLAELPFASLDAIRFHRDKVSSGQVEATIRLTFFVASQPSWPTPTSPSTGARLITETVR